MDRLRLDVFEQYSVGAIIAEDQHGRVHRNAGFASMQGSYRIDGGLGRLTSGLARNLAPGLVNLNVRVKSLTRESDGVVVGVERAGQPMSIRANRVVLALPPRIAEATIAFRPELPATVRRALAAVPTWMAGQAKILAVYDRRTAITPRRHDHERSMVCGKVAYFSRDPNLRLNLVGISKGHWKPPRTSRSV